MSQYLIKQGDHYSTPNIVAPFFGKRVLTCNLTLDASCLYKFDSVDDFDLNKASGLSFGITGSDSARIGWRVADYELGLFELHAYIHINGSWVRTDNNEYRIGYFKVNEQVQIYLDTANNQAIYLSNKGSLTVPFVNTKNRFGYVSQIYFGGNRTSPHDMNVNYNYNTK